jgi:hypothetical protein
VIRSGSSLSDSRAMSGARPSAAFNAPSASAAARRDGGSTASQEFDQLVNIHPYRSVPLVLATVRQL